MEPNVEILEFVSFALLRAVHLLHGAAPGAEQVKFASALHDLRFAPGAIGDIADRALGMREDDVDCDLSSIAHEFIGAVCSALPALAASTSVDTASAVLRYTREAMAARAASTSVNTAEAVLRHVREVVA